MEWTVTVDPFGIVSMILLLVEAPDLIFRFSVVLLVPAVTGATGAGVTGAGTAGAGGVTAVRY